MAKKPKPPRGPQLDLAGDLGIAFVNTTSAQDWNFQQGFRTYDELVTWGQQADLLDAAAAERLRRLAAERPGDAAAVAARAIELRKNLFRVLFSIIKREDPAPAHLEVLNAALTTSMPAVRVVPGEGGLKWGWGGDEEALDRMIWAPAHAIADLLVSAEASRIRQCARKGCTLFFVARNTRRKWCGEVCRNRSKALRYYHRKVRGPYLERMHREGFWEVKRPRKRRFY